MTEISISVIKCHLYAIHVEGSLALNEISILLSERLTMQGWGERLTPCQSEYHSPTIRTHRMKEEKGKTIGDNNGASR